MEILGRTGIDTMTCIFLLTLFIELMVLMDAMVPRDIMVGMETEGKLFVTRKEKF